MPNILLPANLSKKLSQDPKLQGAVNLSLSDITPCVSSERPEFFPLFTNHGIDHLNRVLELSELLIAESSWPHLTAGDAAFLVMSIVMHDAAMHMTRHSFLTLLEVESWKLRWVEFLLEIRRSDDERRLGVFGNEIEVRQLPSKGEPWESGHARLIGEFLRLNHHRLAELISISGIPGTAVALSSGFTKLQKALIGTVARSHGEPLRGWAETMKRKQQAFTYLNCHPTFLAGILRLADYLHLTSDRAPFPVFESIRPSEPIPDREWQSHEAIESFDPDAEDPRAYRLVAHPESINTYERIRYWQADIQREMDQC